MGFAGKGADATAIPGSTAMVKDAGGKDVAFDPNTMSSDTVAPAPLAVPSWQQNWLSTGGTNNAITFDGTGVTASKALDTWNGAAAPVPPPVVTPVDTKGGYGGAGTKVATPAKTTTPAAAATPQYTVIPMNAQGGYNMPGTQQPMAVSDQYNPSQGSSNQTAMPTSGVYNAPSIMSKPIFSDSKGGYYSKDPSGKMVPLTGQALASAKGMFDPMGYGAQ
jgi:hypothetical protein